MPQRFFAGVAFLGWLTACATAQRTAPPIAQDVAPTAALADAEGVIADPSVLPEAAPSAAVSPEPAASPSAEASGATHWPALDLQHPPLTPDVRHAARAKKLLERGLVYFRHGEYDQGEDALKQSLTLNPYSVEANVGLGKIFLMRGMATHDATLLKSARMMFQMAHTLNPNLPDSALLLQLFDDAQNRR